MIKMEFRVCSEFKATQQTDERGFGTHLDAVLLLDERLHLHEALFHVRVERLQRLGRLARVNVERCLQQHQLQATATRHVSHTQTS